MRDGAAAARARPARRAVEGGGHRGAQGRGPGAATPAKTARPATVRPHRRPADREPAAGRRRRGSRSDRSRTCCCSRSARSRSAPARLVVTSTHLVRAGLYLVVSLGAVAGLYLVLGAELVAWVQVLIYVGAVVVLLLFAVMLTRAPIGAVATTWTARPGRRCWSAAASGWAWPRCWPTRSAGRTSTLPDAGTAERIGDADLRRLGAAVRGALGAAARRAGRRDRAVPPGHRRPQRRRRRTTPDARGHPVRHRRAAVRPRRLRRAAPAQRGPGADGGRADAQRGQPDLRHRRRSGPRWSACRSRLGVPAATGRQVFALFVIVLAAAEIGVGPGHRAAALPAAARRRGRRGAARPSRRPTRSRPTAEAGRPVIADGRRAGAAGRTAAARSGRSAAAARRRAAGGAAAPRPRPLGIAGAAVALAIAVLLLLVARCCRTRPTTDRVQRALGRLRRPRRDVRRLGSARPRCTSRSRSPWSRWPCRSTRSAYLHDDAAVRALRRAGQPVHRRDAAGRGRPAT